MFLRGMAMKWLFILATFSFGSTLEQLRFYFVHIMVPQSEIEKYKFC